MSTMPRRKGPPAGLKLAMPPKNLQNPSSLAVNDTSVMSASTVDSADNSPSSSKPRSLRNMKKLSLNLPSAQSSTNSLLIPSEPASAVNPTAPSLSRPRRPSIISLPSAKPTLASTLSNRKEDEGGDGSAPYADGPIEVMPGIWLGSEDNTRDWPGLRERRIRAILNVAKEVASPYDTETATTLRPTASTPNMHGKYKDGSQDTYYPPHLASGRPGMHYLKLQWSHGQQNLVNDGFQEAMSFTDAAVERGDGILIHCQCGISRSATLAIAIVMRAAAERSPSVPSEVWALKGMQGAYTYVKEKSKWIGPNMSLIYQLLDYEKKLKEQTNSPSSDRSSAIAEEEDEWARNRKLLDEIPADEEEENPYVAQEAKALDKAMEDRIIARKSSASSLASSNGVGMGPAWRSRYGGRKRAGSVASNMTNTTTISEDLMEDVEDRDGFTVSGFESDQTSSVDPERSSSNSPQDITVDPPSWSTPTTARPFIRSLPSAPAWKTTFGGLPPMPATAARSTFDIPPRPKHRMLRLSSLPPVPSSPIHVADDDDSDMNDAIAKRKSTASEPSSPPVRTRVDSKKPAPPPLHLRSSLLFKTHNSSLLSPSTSTPSQTLFVFPPSPSKRSIQTPSTMTLTSTFNVPVPFPAMSTPRPRVSTMRSHGRTRSFIGVSQSQTTTTGISQVDARGCFGWE